jgi:hypothetical protein
MFTMPLIRADDKLTAAVKSLLNEREMEPLKHNEVEIGIYMVTDGKIWEYGGKVVPATDVEKLAGHDVIIYISEAWADMQGDIDVEAMVYQLMSTISPMVKGRNNDAVIEIIRDRNVCVSPETVKRYGKNIKWYKSIYEDV